MRDLTGALKVWIEIGAPDAARLHKASKAAPRVVVYTHKDPAQLQRQAAGERIHKSESIELYAIDRDLIDAIVLRLDRRMKLDLSVSDGTMYLVRNDRTVAVAAGMNPNRSALIRPHLTYGVHITCEPVCVTGCISGCIRLCKLFD